MISKEELLKLIKELSSNEIMLDETVPKETKKYLMCHRYLTLLEDYDEVIDVVFDFLKETQKQVGESVGPLVHDAINEILADTLEEHGWLDDEDLQDEVNKEIYNKNKK